MPIEIRPRIVLAARCDVTMAGDVAQRIQQKPVVTDELMKQDISFEYLSKEFFPQTHFYADDLGNIVFYLQPGVLRLDGQPVFYAYTVQELEALLTGSQ